MLEKKTKIRDSLRTGSRYHRLIQIWKLLNKVLSARIKGVLPNLISSNQTTYVTNRFVSESGRMISDILEIAKTIALEVSHHRYRKIIWFY